MIGFGRQHIDARRPVNPIIGCRRHYTDALGQWREVIGFGRHHTDARRPVDLIIGCRRHYTDALAPVEGSDRLWETPHRCPETGGSNNWL